MGHISNKVLRPRWLAATTYLLYATAGFAFLLLQASGIKELLGDIGFVVWNLMLIVGGAIGAFGSITKKHRIELIGTPGVVVGLAVYTIFIGLATLSTDSPGVTIGLAAICGGAALGNIGRGIEVFRAASINERWGKRIKSERSQGD